MISEDLKGILYMFATFCLYFILPLIPSIVIYKLFPDTQVAASGPFKGFKINTSGAFAAYFILLLMGLPMINNIYTQIIIGSNQLVTLQTKVDWFDDKGKRLDSREIETNLKEDRCHIIFEGQTIPSNAIYRNTLQDKFYLTLPASFTKEQNHSCIKFQIDGFNPVCIIISDTAFNRIRDVLDYKPGLKLRELPPYTPADAAKPVTDGPVIIKANS